MHLCTCVSEEGDDGEVARSETPSLLSYTLRDVSFAEVGSICRVVLRAPMHLCTCVNEEGGDGEAACSETSSLLLNTLRCVSFARGRQSLPNCVERTDAPVHMREGGRRGSCVLRNAISAVIDT